MRIRCKKIKKNMEYDGWHVHGNECGGGFDQNENDGLAIAVESRSTRNTSRGQRGKRFGEDLCRLTSLKGGSFNSRLRSHHGKSEENERYKTSRAALNGKVGTAKARESFWKGARTEEKIQRSFARLRIEAGRNGRVKRMIYLFGTRRVREKERRKMKKKEKLPEEKGQVLRRGGGDPPLD